MDGDDCRSSSVPGQILKHDCVGADTSRMLPAHDPHVAQRTIVRRVEHALSLVEIMVVMFIIALVIGLGINSLRGSQNTGGKFEMKGVASRYADAVDRFKADHGRHVPTLGSATWPTADAQLGPRTIVNLSSGSTTKYYVKNPIPEILERGEPNNAEFVDSASAVSAEGGTLVYERRTAYQFTISAYWYGELLCVAGDIDPGDNQC